MITINNMIKPTKQHYVPQCYLREFADPTTLPNKEPFIWIFNKDGKNKRKDKIRNVLASNDLYTLKINGQKNYVIEETLANLERKYTAVFRDKIKNRLPLNEEEHIILCAFVSVILQRTLRHKDNLERFIDELIEHTEAIEKAHNLKPKKSLELKKHREYIHKIGVVQLLPDIAELLIQMKLAFLCAEGGATFITSDDPCNLFNPDLQWQRFYGPGLAQKNVQVTLPLSPDIMLCMSWSNLRGYILWEKSRVQEANRMVVGHCYKYFVSHSPKPKRMWFRRYPLDIFFILKVLGHKIEMWHHKIKMWHRFKNVRRK
jgi:hypothetical protein